MSARAGQSQRKRALLDAAQGLMLEKGFVATTVDEICAKARATKGSFFYYFKSKEEFGKELIERFSSCTTESVEDRAEAAADPLDRVYGQIDCAIAMSQDPNMKGCLVGTFAQELSESHPDIRCLCAKSFEERVQTLKTDLAEAKRKYAPRASFDVTSLAESFIAVTQGAIILMKANKDRGIMARTLEHYKSYLKCLFGR